LTGSGKRNDHRLPTSLTIAANAVTTATGIRTAFVAGMTM
jgi:hypothetical protein